MNVDQLIQFALEEDIGPRDLTTSACVSRSIRGGGFVLAKQRLVMCGHAVARRCFSQVAAVYGGDVRYEVLVPDGEWVEPGTHVARVEGAYRTLLIGERLALNFLMRMSGISTNTRAYVDAAGEGGTRIADTRKTTPLHREIEKYAVRVGGGANHRMALYDGVMIKDNHLAATGDMAESVRAARAKNHHLVRIEVEVATIEQLDQALSLRSEDGRRRAVDVIMLDNFDDAGLAAAVAHAREVAPDVILEGSGNMTPERIANLKDVDLDVISAGGLIHQAKWVDLSLKVKPLDV